MLASNIITMIEKLKESVLSIDEENVELAERYILEAENVLCDGLGRSKLYCSGFAMRLMQMGMASYVVGEMSTPAITANDTLVICSGSGRSNTLIEHAKKAKEVGARIVTVTGNEESELIKLSDSKIVIKASTKTSSGHDDTLPMGSQFEDTSILLFESMIVDLMKKKSETSETMYNRHANLE